MKVSILMDKEGNEWAGITYLHTDTGNLFFTGVRFDAKQSGAAMSVNERVERLGTVVETYGKEPPTSAQPCGDLSDGVCWEDYGFGHGGPTPLCTERQICDYKKRNPGIDPWTGRPR